MNIPLLKPKSRSREFDSYSNDLKSKIICSYLFDGKSHRLLDSDVLGLDSVYSKGYQSMGVLHFVGLRGDFKSIFKGLSLAEAIELLEENEQDFSQVIAYLTPSDTISYDAFIQQEELAVRESLNSEYETRRNRINDASQEPERTQVYSFVYKRNPDIVAEALRRANGVCEKCDSPAPFVRSTDGTPYLEVHHIIPLSKKGEDSLGNVIAVCPNCHRELHFG